MLIPISTAKPPFRHDVPHESETSATAQPGTPRTKHRPTPAHSTRVGTRESKLGARSGWVARESCQPAGHADHAAARARGPGSGPPGSYRWTGRERMLWFSAEEPIA